MPYCKSCHQEISKFDVDVCPYCGQEHPIDAGYKTMDITKTIDPLAEGYSLYKSKSQRKWAILTMLLGYLGVGSFYIGFKKRGLIELLLSVILIAGVGTILFLLVLKNAFAYLIPFFAIWLVYIVIGVICLKKDSPKDASGEFLR